MYDKKKKPQNRGYKSYFELISAGVWRSNMTIGNAPETKLIKYMIAIPARIVEYDTKSPLNMSWVLDNK